MSKPLMYGLFAVGALVLFEMFKGGSMFGGSTTGYQSYNPMGANYLQPGSTAQNVTVGASAASSLITAFSGLFSGRSTQPLTSGASPANPNNLNSSGADQNSIDAASSGFFGL